MKTSEQKIYEQLSELYESEHGGCDSTTCGMHVAYEQGYEAHAFECFYSSGASSEEFARLYEQLGCKKMRNASAREAKMLCKEVEHDECERCGATVWHVDWNGGHCSNCGGNTPKKK